MSLPDLKALLDKTCEISPFADTARFSPASTSPATFTVESFEVIVISFPDFAL